MTAFARSDTQLLLRARPHLVAWTSTALHALVQRLAVLVVVLAIAVLGPLGCVIHCAFVVPLNPLAHTHAGQQNFFCRTHGAEAAAR